MRCKRFRARINNLLDLLQLNEERGTDWEILTSDYDRASVRNTLVLERERAIKYLKDSLSINKYER